jgi:Holliday junction resolvasome RuvABC endonuclease subunit
MIVGLDTAGDRWHAVDEFGVMRSAGPLEHQKKSAPFYDPRWQNADARREELCRQFHVYLKELVRTEDGDPAKVAICCEYPLSLKNPQTNVMLSLAAGALWDVGRSWGVTWLWVEISKWKKIVVGNGNADKKRVQAYVALNYRVELAEDDNVADATCICECGVKAIEQNVDPATL